MSSGRIVAYPEIDPVWRLDRDAGQAKSGFGDGMPVIQERCKVLLDFVPD
jgi:hypothetical protein